MAGGELTGLEGTLAKLKGITPEIVIRVSKAVRITANRVAIHAKAGHTPGQGHAQGRYENVTTNLTSSIIPTMVHIGPDFIEAAVGPSSTPKLTMPIAAIMEYAPKVEIKFPFMRPAKESQREPFKKAVQAAIHGK